MIQLDLTPDEAEILKDALESYLADLRMEIAGTDSMDFRETLKDTKATLRKIVEALESQGAVR
ncbi:MAG: hypothetical protein LJF04_05800 [Gemmatimonadetes bacterium]|nr:hypothetical protein [Gemmatimonadota bacterium]